MLDQYGRSHQLHLPAALDIPAGLIDQRFISCLFLIKRSLVSPGEVVPRLSGVSGIPVVPSSKDKVFTRFAMYDQDSFLFG